MHNSVKFRFQDRFYQLADLVRVRLLPELNFFRDRYGHGPAFPSVTQEDFNAVLGEAEGEGRCASCEFQARELETSTQTIDVKVSSNNEFL